MEMERVELTYAVTSLMKGRDFLSLKDFDSREILRILDVADILKREKRSGVFRDLLAYKSIGMIFEKPSTRTRVSFEVGVFELGGHALDLRMQELQLSRGESVEDTFITLSKYCDAIVARVSRHEDLIKMAEAADVPVINALSDLHHPCQILADLQTIREVKGGFKGLKLAWIGDGNNVCNSLLIGSSKIGLNITIAGPKGYQPNKKAIEAALEAARETGSKIELLEDPEEAVKDADIVATDTFISMGLDEERDKRLKVFLPKYQVNERLTSLAKKDFIFMHCLPAKRGEEVSSGVIDGPRSVVWQEAENRLHTQKALLCLLLLEEDKLPW